MKKLIYGRGICDVNVTTKCEYYTRWVCLLKRVYSLAFKLKNPTYENCTMCEDWLTLSNFIRWVDSQPNRDWKNCHLDKDLLFNGNKHYSPETCVFISSVVNNFILDRCNDRGDYLIGAYYHKRDNKFVSRCRDPFNLNSRHLGYFNTEIEAHLAWKTKKHEYACKLSQFQQDRRVIDALCTRYI